MHVFFFVVYKCIKYSLRRAIKACYNDILEDYYLYFCNISSHLKYVCASLRGICDSFPSLIEVTQFLIIFLN